MGTESPSVSAVTNGQDSKPTKKRTLQSVLARMTTSNTSCTSIKNALTTPDVIRRNAENDKTAGSAVTSFDLQEKYLEKVFSPILFNAVFFA